MFFENGNQRKRENLFSPDAREKPRLFLASFGKAAGIRKAKMPKPFAPKSVTIN
jgi:hypothetical protein